MAFLIKNPLRKLLKFSKMEALLYIFTNM